MSDRFMIVECFGDSVFSQQMKYEAAKVHTGIGDVINRMVKYYSNRFALGVIDFDKGIRPGTLKNDCKEILSEKKHGLILLKHDKRPHYFLVLVTEFEDWIDSAASEKKINRTKYKLPEDLRKFKELVKRREIEDNLNFKNYLNAIIQSNPSRIAAFRKFVREAQNHHSKKKK